MITTKHEVGRTCSEEYGGAERSTWGRGVGHFFITYLHEILRNKEKSKVNENISAVNS